LATPGSRDVEAVTVRPACPPETTRRAVGLGNCTTESEPKRLPLSFLSLDSVRTTLPRLFGSSAFHVDLKTRTGLPLSLGTNIPAEECQPFRHPGAANISVRPWPACHRLRPRQEHAALRAMACGHS
jgi:hypothetical protein